MAKIERIIYTSGTLSHQEMNRANGRIAALEAILADRERELLELKGPCSNAKCSLHYAHSGPCNGKGDGNG